MKQALHCTCSLDLLFNDIFISVIIFFNFFYHPYSEYVHWWKGHCVASFKQHTHSGLFNLEMDH